MDLSAFVNHVTVLTGLAVMAVQQILKFKIVPPKFANRYPVPTLIVLSVLGALVATWKTGLVTPVSWTDWVLLVASIGVTAAGVYNATVKHWTEVRDMESDVV